MDTEATADQISHELRALRDSLLKLSRQAKKATADEASRQFDSLVQTAERVSAGGADESPRHQEEPPVVFLHIPKTAGSSLGSALKLLHGDGYVWAGNFFARVEDGRLVRKKSLESDPQKLRRRADALAPKLSGAALVQAHAPLALRSLFPTNSRFFTFLREPAERSLSHFYYFLYRSRIEAGLDPPPPDLTLARYLSERQAEEFDVLLPDNLQTRMLAGSPIEAPASQEMLDAAKRNLRELDVVGIAERFEESHALLHVTYGWRLLLPADRKINTTNGPADAAVRKADLEAARTVNALDEELYADAVELFQSALAERAPEVEGEVEALRRAWQLVRAGDSGRRIPGPTALVEERAHAIVAETRAAILEQAPAPPRHALAALATELPNAVRSVERLTSLVARLAAASDETG